MNQQKKELKPRRDFEVSSTARIWSCGIWSGLFWQQRVITEGNNKNKKNKNLKNMQIVAIIG